METDRKNSIIVGVIGFFLFVFGVSYHFAFAYTYTREPSGTDINNPVTFTITLDDVSELGTDILTGGDAWGFEIYSENPPNILSNCVPITETYLQFTTNLPVGNYQGVGISGNSAANCDTSRSTSGDFEPEPYTGDTIFSVLASENNSSIWQSNNGFWGSTTISDVTTSMEASVQATGINIYSLLKFMGLPILFTIALLLIHMINDQLSNKKATKSITNPVLVKRKRGRPRKTIINPTGSDFIEHSFNDLEFKRNYGSSKDK